MNKELRSSVIICTLGKRKTLIATIRSILYNTSKPYEILIVHQGETHIKHIIQGIRSSSVKLRYIHISKPNVSNAKNIGIKHAKGEILMFTDDDCIADVSWVRNCLNHFKKDPNCFCLTGMVKVYLTEKDKYICQGASFIKKRAFSINRTDVISYRDVGIGNNISFRAELFRHFGLFNTSLGPGTIGESAEDMDMVYRTLENGISISYSPKMIIYHNKWLTQYQEIIQQVLYTRGLVTCCINMYLITRKKYYIDHIFYRINERFFKHRIPYNKPHLQIILIAFEIYNLFIGLFYGIYIYRSRKNRLAI